MRERGRCYIQFCCSRLGHRVLVADHVNGLRMERDKPSRLKRSKSRFELEKRGLRRGKVLLQMRYAGHTARSPRRCTAIKCNEEVLSSGKGSVQSWDRTS